MDDSILDLPAVPDVHRIKRRAWMWCLLWWVFAAVGFYQLQHHLLIYWDHREPLVMTLDAYLEFQPRDRLLELSHCSINYTEAWRAVDDEEEPPLLLVPLRRDHDYPGAAKIVMMERGTSEKLDLVKQLEALTEKAARDAFLKQHYNTLFREETVFGWLTPAEVVPKSLRAAFEDADLDIDPQFVLVERDWQPGLRPFWIWLAFSIIAFLVGFGQLKWGQRQVRRQGVSVD